MTTTTTPIVSSPVLADDTAFVAAHRINVHHPSALYFPRECDLDAYVGTNLRGNRRWHMLLGIEGRTKYQKEVNFDWRGLQAWMRRNSPKGTRAPRVRLHGSECSTIWKDWCASHHVPRHQMNDFMKVWRETRETTGNLHPCEFVMESFVRFWCTRALEITAHSRESAAAVLSYFNARTPDANERRERCASQIFIPHQPRHYLNYTRYRNNSDWDVWSCQIFGDQSTWAHGWVNQPVGYLAHLTS